MAVMNVLLVSVYLTLVIAMIVFMVSLRLQDPEKTGEHANAIKATSPEQWLESNTVFWKKGIEGSVKYAGIVDRVYAIVLPERQAGFEKKLAKSGLLENIWMLKAMPRNTLPYNDLFKIGLLDERFFKAFENKGRTACHLSHLACLYHFSKSGLENCLILEDDSVELGPGTIDHVKNIYNDAKQNHPNFNILYYGYNYEPSKVSYADPNPRKHMPGETWQLKRPFGRHAYLVNQESTKHILDNCMKLNNAGDVKYTHLIKDGKLRAVGPAIRMFNQDQCSYKTTLGNDTGLCIPPQFDRMR